MWLNQHLLVVSALFDFASVGTGSFAFAPVKTFQNAPNAQNFSERTTIETASSLITIAVTGDVAPHTLSRRSVDICTDASKKAFIDASFDRGKQHHLARGVGLAYWGTLASSRVISILDAVANENSTSQTLSCVDCYDFCSFRGPRGVIAYTLLATINVYFCDIFFEEVPTTSLCSGTSVEWRIIRGGTTLHEVYISHIIAAGTGDVTYGCSQDRGLPDQLAIQNADSFNVYKNTKC
ncbi:hypothetical protein C8R44DRAFT_870694 [Mycena epipterygia]|nr:hypothetical protein C8R44DRAFT_870694 [Mycena epipterygia]